jgi:Ca2+-binding RTX toxin-like protein
MTNFNDNLAASSAANSITGGDGDDFLWGGAGNDTLMGGAGNDELDGGVGNDSMAGGAGNDTYYVDSATDVVVENSGEGTDTIFTSVAPFTLNTAALAHVENLGIYGPWVAGPWWDDGDAYGISGLNFTLTGNAQNNLIEGSNGLDAREFAQVLGRAPGTNGSAGFDLIQKYWVEAPVISPAVIKTDISFIATYSDGTKISLVGTGFTGTGASHAMTITSATVTQVVASGLTETLAFTGSITVQSTGPGSAMSSPVGKATQSTWSSGSTHSAVFYVHEKVTYTGSWDLSPQTMGYYAGKEVTNITSVLVNSYSYDSGLTIPITSALTVTGNVTSIEDALGEDHYSGAITGITVSDGVTGSAPKTWTGSVAWSESVNDAITNNNDDGSTLFDVIPMSSILGGNDTINGGDGSDSLAGGLGTNVIDGGVGSDTLFLSGAREDYIFSRPAATTVTPALTQTVLVTNITLQTEGIVETHSISTIENVVFGYISGAVMPGSIALLDLLGNTASLTDDSLTGNESANYLDGLAGNDTLSGSGGNDTLIGGLGNDSLVGGIGADSMVGGDGNDIYDVDDLDDIVTELANSTGGTDTIKTSLNRLSLDPSWGGLGGGQVENLIYTGSGVFGGDGNALANSITGGTGADWLWGGAGNDTLMGGDGNDVLDGVIGTDSMVGGFGNDTYYVDSATDVVVESIGEGTDTILTSAATFTLAALTNVENLGVDGPWWNEGELNYGASGLNFTLTGNTQNNLIEGSNGLDAREFAQVLGRASGPSESAGFDLIKSYWSQSPTLLPIINANGTTFSAIYDDGTKIELIGTGFTGTGILHAMTITSATVTQHDVDLFTEDLTETLAFTGSITVQSAGPGSAMSSPVGKATQSIWSSGFTDLAGFHPDEKVTFAGSWDLSPQTAGYKVTNITSILVNTFNYEFGLPIISSLTMTGNVTETEYVENVDSLYSGSITGVTVSDGATGSTPKTWTVNIPWSQSAIDLITDNGTDGSTIFDVIQMSSMSSIFGGNDSINGGDGNDSLAGGLGANVIDGGAGSDTLLLRGESGDYIFTRPTETSVTLTNRTAGIVESHALSNIENVVFGYSPFDEIGASVTLGSLLGNTASAWGDELSGNNDPNLLDGLAGNDTLLGGGGNDTLIGGLGNDSLVGGTGSDSMVGGDGNDIYDVDNLGDIVVELANAGTDTIKTSISYSLLLGNNLENLELTGDISINGTGNALANTITGNQYNNILDGDAGADTLTGGGGDDIYIVDLTTLGALQDTVTAEGTNAGTDTLQLRGSAVLSTAVTLTLAAELEKFDASATGATKLNLVGNVSANFLTGNNADNTLNGGDGNDSLAGGLGANVIDGGAGSDTLLLRGASGDYIFTRPTETSVTITNRTAGTAGIVESHTVSNIERILFDYTTIGVASVTLGSLLGNAASAWSDELTGTDDPNSLDGLAGNDTLLGGGGDDTLIGGLGNDSLVGGDGGDKIIGGSGDDTLDGGLGTSDRADYSSAVNGVNINLVTGVVIGIGDLGLSETGTDKLFNLEKIYGGSGNDIFVTSSDSVYLNGGAGKDKFYLGSGGADIDAGIGNDFIEAGNLSMSPTNLKGEEGIDTISFLTMASPANNNLGIRVDLSTGALGSSSIHLSGFENAIGSDFNDELIGNNQNNIIKGEGGNDTLDGGFGADRLVGEWGDDVYIVDNSWDTVIEDYDNGRDEVRSSVTYTLQRNVENLTLTGDGGINGTGNSIDNVLTGNNTSNTLDGGAGKDTLNGGMGDDSLYGGIGSDSLYGGDGNDHLDGGIGADLMAGGIGNDTYVVNSTGDYIDESNMGGGVDTVLASKTFSLGPLGGYCSVTGDVENLTLTGKAAINGTGNNLNNVLIGNVAANYLDGGAGNDTLMGGSGSDTLTGGEGSDCFVFSTAASRSTNMDTITDFVSGTDYIQLSKAIFTGLGNAGSLTTDQFWSGGGVVAAHDATDRIIYNTTSGALYYDADGNGGGAAVVLATLVGNLTITLDDLVMV